MTDPDDITFLPARGVPLKRGATEAEAVKAAECPDCASTVIMSGPDDNDWWSAAVNHDDTCPTFARRLREEGQE